MELSVFINRPPQEVFDFLANPDNDLLWQNNLTLSEWTSPGSPGAGSTKRVVSKVFGRETEATAEFTVWDRPNRYGFKSAAGPFTVSGTTSFEAHESGTMVFVKGQIEASGLMKLAEGLVARLAKKQDTTNFNNLKRLLEAS